MLLVAKKKTKNVLLSNRWEHTTGGEEGKDSSEVEMEGERTEGQMKRAFPSGFRESPWILGPVGDWGKS